MEIYLVIYLFSYCFGLQTSLQWHAFVGQKLFTVLFLMFLGKIIFSLYQNPEFSKQQLKMIIYLIEILVVIASKEKQSYSISEQVFKIYTEKL